MVTIDDDDEDDDDDDDDNDDAASRRVTEESIINSQGQIQDQGFKLRRYSTCIDRRPTRTTFLPCVTSLSSSFDNKIKLESVQLQGHPDFAPVDLAYYQHFLAFLFENIAFWEVPSGNHPCRARSIWIDLDAEHVVPRPLVNVK